MQLETQEEKELWKAVLCAVLSTESFGSRVAINAADEAVHEFRKRTYVEKLDTGI